VCAWVHRPLARIASTWVRGPLARIASTWVHGPLARIASTWVHGPLARIVCAWVHGPLARIASTWVRGPLARIVSTSYCRRRFGQGAAVLRLYIQRRSFGLTPGVPQLYTMLSPQTSDQQCVFRRYTNSVKNTVDCVAIYLRYSLPYTLPHSCVCMMVCVAIFLHGWKQAIRRCTRLLRASPSPFAHLME